MSRFEIYLGIGYSQISNLYLAPSFCDVTLQHAIRPNKIAPTTQP